MDNHLVRVPVRRTGRLLAVLMLVVALVIIALAPMVSAETVVPAATVPGDRPAGDAPGTVGLDAWSCPDNLLLNPSFELGSGSLTLLGGSCPGKLDTSGQRFHRRDNVIWSPGRQPYRLCHSHLAEQRRRDHVPAGCRCGGDYV